MTRIRVSALVIPMVLAATLLGGCGGKTPLNENFGGIPPGDPVVNSLSPSTTAAAGSGFTLTVTGTAFAQGDTVMWGNQPLSSTFVSSTEMQAQVTTSDIAAAQSVQICVATTPAQTFNYCSSFVVSPITPVTSGFTTTPVSVEANDMAWDPGSQQIFVSIASTNPTNPNTLAALNPSTASWGTAQNVGTDPDQLAISADDSYLYAGIDGQNLVQRFTLPGPNADIDIPLKFPVNALAPLYAMDLQVSPANSSTIAVLTGEGSAPYSGTVSDGLFVYDDATARSAYANSGLGNSIQWNSTATQIFGCDANNDLWVFSVSSSGVGQSQNYTDDAPCKLHYLASTGYLYSDSGTVVDPSSGISVGSFPLLAVGGTAFTGVMVPDDKLNVAYFFGQTSGAFSSSTPSAYYLEVFDLTTYKLLGVADIDNVVGAPIKLIRWGANGLAVLTGTSNGPAPGDGIYLISGTFISNPGGL